MIGSGRKRFPVRPTRFDIARILVRVFLFGTVCSDTWSWILLAIHWTGLRVLPGLFCLASDARQQRTNAKTSSTVLGNLHRSAARIRIFALLRTHRCGTGKCEQKEEHATKSPRNLVSIRIAFDLDASQHRSSCAPQGLERCLSCRKDRDGFDAHCWHAMCFFPFQVKKSK